MAEDSRKLFVAGLPDTITEDVLRQLFEATGGAVVEVSLPKDRTTGRPRGFGFVTMSTSDEANAARESLHGSFQGGRSISVRPFESAPPKRGEGGAGPRSSGAPPDSPDRKIYIGNLPYDATPEEVEAAVNGTGAGPVVRVIMPSDQDGRKRGFAFAYMASAEAARGAIDLLRGVEVRGRRLVVNHAHDRPPPREGGFSGPPSGPRSDYHGAGPRSDFGGPPSHSFGGPPSGGGGGGGPGGGGGGGGGPDRRPAPGRKAFDEKRKRSFDDGGGVGGGRKNKRNNDWDTRGDDDD
ncbi:MAG: RNA-binding protein [Polyangiaceae bacterium]